MEKERERVIGHGSSFSWLVLRLRTVQPGPWVKDLFGGQRGSRWRREHSWEKACWVSERTEDAWSKKVVKPPLPELLPQGI
jgi:hypothetical protein